MKIVVWGSNTASHFICQKILNEKNIDLVYHIGANKKNKDTEKYKTLFFENNENLLDFFRKEEIDLVIPTTVRPIITKEFRKILDSRNIPILGPSLELGNLEWSKIYGKNFLKKINIPTPNSVVMRKEKLIENFLSIPRPFVVKFDRDWRAGNQTLIITDDNFQDEFEKLKKTGSIRFVKGIGDFQNQRFLVEEFVQGTKEYSYHALCNETGRIFLGAARDYKKLYEGDFGPNTDGMGCYSPIEIDSVVHEYCDKILSELKNQGTPYIGILYLGILVKTNGEPVVLEINVRTGDPEIQTILSILDPEQSLSEIFLKTANNSDIPNINIMPNRSSVSISIVNKDYEKNLEKRIYNPLPDPDLPELSSTSDIIVSNSDSGLLISSIVTTDDVDIERSTIKIFNFLKDKNLLNYTYRKDIGFFL